MTQFVIQFDAMHSAPDGSSIKRTETKFCNEHTTVRDIWNWYQGFGGDVYRTLGDLKIMSE